MMTTRASMLRALALSVLAAVGCGGGSPVSIEDLHAQGVSASCDQLIRCGAVASHDVCVAELGRLFDFDDVEAGVKNGTITYDADQAGDCLDAEQNLSCDPSDKGVRVTPDACKNAIKGKLADGAQCFFDQQCVSGGCNLPSDCSMTCCAGTCDPSPPAAVAIGAACTAAPCVDGAFCDNGTCAALLAAGASCISDGECDYGLVCAGATFQSSTCTKVPQVGDACIGNNECPRLGTACDSTQHCVARLDAGATCDPAKSLCKGDLACDPTAKTCGAPPAIGSTCTGSCASGAYCKFPTGIGAGTCTKLGASGDACENDGQCDSNYCDPTAATCALKPVCA